MSAATKHLQAAWLRAPGFQRVCAALQSDGFVVRAVGGAVRDSLRNGPQESLAATDIDLATDATPDAVLDAMATAGLRTLPTGIAHGTLTVLTDTGPYEVTTLRADIETDGRHATVAFTRDWTADAERRDFTINAIYCDPDGTVFDPVSGIGDLDAKRLRFIGNGNARISEDYLRILRLFRFYAQLPEFDISEADFEACTRGRSGLQRLSKERVRAEWFKLLGAQAAPRAIHALIERGLWLQLFPTVPSPATFERCMAVERKLADTAHSQSLKPDPLLRLAALAIQMPEDVDRLRVALRLSNGETQALREISETRAKLGAFKWHPRDAMALRYRHDHERFSQLAMLAVSLHPEPTDFETIAELLTWSADWQRPVFPLTGHDAIAAGITPGPRIGVILAQIEQSWIAGGFEASTEDLRLQLAEHARPPDP